MADRASTPMSRGAIFAIVILAGTVVGGLLGLLRAELGGPVWLAGALSGAVVGALMSILYRRRERALKRDQ